MAHFAGGSHGVYAAVVIGGRGARAVATHRLLEEGRVAVVPDFLAGFHVIGGDELFVAPLLDGVGAAFTEDETGVSATDGLLPQGLQRPLGVNGLLGGDAVTARPAEIGPIGRRNNGCCIWFRLLGGSHGCGSRFGSRGAGRDAGLLDAACFQLFDLLFFRSEGEEDAGPTACQFVAHQP